MISSTGNQHLVDVNQVPAGHVIFEARVDAKDSNKIHIIWDFETLFEDPQIGIDVLDAGMAALAKAYLALGYTAQAKALGGGKTLSPGTRGEEAATFQVPAGSDAPYENEYGVDF